MPRTITTRQAKGTSLTYDEMDANFLGLDQDLAALESSAGGSALPSGGTAGQLLVKKSSDAGDAAWENFVFDGGAA
jgi:hypothetical protein